MGQLDDTVRSEIIERIKLRDQTFSIYAAAVAAIIGFGLQSSNYLRALLIIPPLSLSMALLLGYHDVVIQYLHEYLAKQGIGWDKSKARDQYSKDPRKYMFLVSQVLVFVGSSIATLLMNLDLFTKNNWALLSLWITDAIFLFMTILVIFHVRIWRHMIQPRIGDESINNARKSKK